MKIQFTENYRNTLYDTFNNSRPKGHVKIFDKTSKELLGKENIEFPNIKLHDGPNLIVYSGRNWLMQRAFNKDYSSGSGLKDMFISWFGVGIGGADDNDVLQPLVPTLNDTELADNVVLDSSNVNYANSGYLKPISSNIIYDEDIENENKRLIATITNSLEYTDGNGPDGTSHYDISEAGLYISPVSSVLNSDSITTHLFARVNFSTIRKTLDRQYDLVWSIYF